MARRGKYLTLSSKFNVKIVGTDSGLPTLKLHIITEHPTESSLEKVKM